MYVLKSICFILKKKVQKLCAWAILLVALSAMSVVAIERQGNDDRYLLFFEHKQERTVNFMKGVQKMLQDKISATWIIDKTNENNLNKEYDESHNKGIIILIHGLFSHATYMKYIEKVLANNGYRVYSFSYPSVMYSMEDNVEALNRFAHRVQEKNEQGLPLHFVGHSLGGLLIRLLYEKTPEVFTGRIVTLGTPHNGSIVAQNVQKYWLSRKLIERPFDQALKGDLPQWEGKIELGSIAGTMALGTGKLLNIGDDINDGTVKLEETFLENETDHINIHTTHLGMTFSNRVCKQILYFLENGRFDHEKQPSSD